ncbi:MAG: S41 family peptidase [Bacteroidota bacterium]
MRLLLLALAFLFSVPLAAQSADDLITQGKAAYDAGDYAESGRLYAAGIEAGSRDGSDAYNAACAFALSGNTEQAFRHLELAAEFGFTNADLLKRDTDLDSLREDARWPGVVAEFEETAARAQRFWDSPAIPTPYSENLSVDEKVAGLSRLWSEARYNFANFDLVPDLDWDSLYVATLPRVRETESTLEYYRVLMAMVAQLEDGHSNIYPPRELGMQVYARPGLRTRLVEGRVLVSEIRDPALADQGIEIGQEVLRIDGVPVHEYADTHVRPYQSSSTEQDRDVRTYEYMLLAGDVREPVELTLRNADESTASASMARLTREQTEALNWSRDPFVLTMLPGNIAHVQLNTFSGGTEAADQFEARFDEIAQADGLILDVRNNGGGNGGVGFRVLCGLTDAERIPTAGWRTRLYRPAYRAWGQLSQSTDGNPAGSWGCSGDRHFSGPVAILTSPRTFSAAEDFAVAFDLMERGSIVGERTGGSTGQPLFFRLPGGGSGRVTSKRDSYPDGREFVGTGVIPDIAVTPTVADVRAERDRVLEAAIAAILKG